MGDTLCLLFFISNSNHQIIIIYDILQFIKIQLEFSTLSIQKTVNTCKEYIGTNVFVMTLTINITRSKIDLF